MRKITSWLFRAHVNHPTAWRIIRWWEIRRIPFNLIVGTAGLLSAYIYFGVTDNMGFQTWGAQALDLGIFFAAPLLANAVYTLGWMIEIAARALLKNLSLNFAPICLKIGLVVSLAAVSLPAALRIGQSVLRVLG